MLELQVEKLRSFAVVCWLSDNECGVSFDEPLREAEVAALRKEVALAAKLPLSLPQAYDDWQTGYAR